MLYGLSILLILPLITIDLFLCIIWQLNSETNRFTSLNYYYIVYKFQSKILYYFYKILGCSLLL